VFFEYYDIIFVIPFGVLFLDQGHNLGRHLLGIDDKSLHSPFANDCASVLLYLFRGRNLGIVAQTAIAGANIFMQANVCLPVDFTKENKKDSFLGKRKRPWQGK